MKKSQQEIMSMSGYNINESKQINRTNQINLLNKSKDISINDLQVQKKIDYFSLQQGRQINRHLITPSPGRYQKDQSASMQNKVLFRRGQSFKTQDGSNVSIISFVEKKLEDRFKQDHSLLYRQDQSIGIPHNEIFKNIPKQTIKQKFQSCNNDALDLAKLVGIPQRKRRQFQQQ